MDKAAISAAQTAIAALGLTSKISAADQAAFYQAWATEQVAVAITGLTTVVKGLNTSVDNAATNALLVRVLTDIETLLAKTTPA